MVLDEGEAIAAVLVETSKKAASGFGERPIRSISAAAKAIGGGFGLARTAAVDQHLRGEDQSCAAGDVAEQQAEQERAAAGLQELSQTVAAGDMAELVSKKAGDTEFLCSATA